MEMETSTPEREAFENPFLTDPVPNTELTSPLFGAQETSKNGNDADLQDMGKVQSNLESPRPAILYKAEYYNETSDEVVHTHELDNVHDHQSDIEEEPSVLEVVDVHITWHTALARDIKHEGDSQLPPSLVKGHSYIRILSRAVIEALRSVVDFYPSQDLSGHEIKIYEPYQVIVHHRVALEQYRNQFLPGENVPSSCFNQWANQHIKVLLDFVDKKVGDMVNAEKERHDRGVATWDMLWLLFKPGIDVYWDDQADGEYQPYVFNSMDFKIRNGATSEYNICVWNLDADSNYVGACKQEDTIKPFAGEKDITSLRCYPCEYLTIDKEGRNPDERRNLFEQRGRTWFKLRRKGCFYFDGVTDGYPKTRHTGLVMADPVQYYFRATNSDKSERAVLASDAEMQPALPNPCSCLRCVAITSKDRSKAMFGGYTKINPLVEGTTLTPHQFFLCDKRVEVFVFKIRSWKMLDVAGIREPNFDMRMMDKDLVLADDTKRMIKDLTRIYTESMFADDISERLVTTSPKGFQEDTNRKIGAWSADSIKGKGEGLIFLLHGKPGTGKTFTAECIAEHAHRPLLTLTCADIGTNPTDIEGSLTKWFELAKNWGAIMLIDEADIYMEHRQVQDLNRNHVVAGFLRALEYYQGILFLTTNRVGTFDEAFMTRVHVMIYYPAFNEKEREDVWQGFFAKLEDERETQMHILQSTKDYVSSQEVKNLQWNGREIRNGFQIAVALAEAEGDKDKEGRVKVKSEHIRSTVRMSKDFKDYLTKTHHNKNETQRAALWGHRHDAFGGQDPAMRERKI